MAIVFDAAAFRAQFPGQFLDPPYTDAIIELYWDAAVCYVAPVESCFLEGDCLRQAVNLMTAHLITIADAATLGEQVGFVESSQIDKISASIQALPNETYFQAFCNMSPYGIQLYAMLSVRSAGGFYFGGSNEIGSFRRAGGRFSPSSTSGAS